MVVNGFTNKREGQSARSKRPWASLSLRMWGFLVFQFSVTFRAEIVAQSGLSERDVIALPPIDVGAESNARPWSYVSTLDFEVLSRCRDDTTKELIRAQQRMLGSLRMILP